MAKRPPQPEDAADDDEDWVVRQLTPAAQRRRVARLRKQALHTIRQRQRY